MTARIVAHNLGVRFTVDRQRRPTTPTMARVRRRCTTVWGVRGISFSIEPGAAVALVGPNGAGKTTVLRLLAGVLKPDEGTLAVRGRVGSLLSVDGGLMTPLTGRENAMLLGVLAGLPRDRAQDSLEAIARRSGLEQAFNRPVSTYSQGMRARLGFAVIERTSPDVLLLDEVHEALDESYRRQLAAAVDEMRRRGGIVVAAGHDNAELARLCDQALLLGPSGANWLQDVAEASEMSAGAGAVA